MKNRILVVGIVGIFIGVGVGEAREFPKNPDRFPSFGITLESQSLEGDFKSPSAPAFGSQDVESTSRRLTFDTRLPLSNSFTLNLALGLVGGGKLRLKKLHFCTVQKLSRMARIFELERGIILIGDLRVPPR